MKTHIRSLLLVLGLGLLAASCSVQKRQYLPGYHVSWKHTKHHAEQQQALAAQDAPPSGGLTAAGGLMAANAPATDHVKAPAESPAVAPSKETPLRHTAPKPYKSTGLALAPVIKDPVISTVIHKMKSAMTGDGTRVNGFAIAGMVCGIVALFAYYGAFVLGVLAVIFSAIALNKIRSSGERGRVMAIAGLICGIVAIAIVATIVTVAAL